MMFNMKKKVCIIVAGVVMSLVARDGMACASCGCSLNADWSTQGLSSHPGWSIDLRNDDLNQNQLRSGTGSISPYAASHSYNPTTSSLAEVEKYTKTQTVTATIDYNNGETWGVSMSVPYLNRSHQTLGTNSPDGLQVGVGAYDSQASGMGDIRLIGRYYGFFEQKNVGLQFGLKLPTGQTNQFANDGTTQVDPGLQLGTGTTDILFGAYYFGNLNDNWGYFGQVMFQTAITQAQYFGQTYQPGASVNLNAGIRYEGLSWISPTLQINTRVVNTDTGAAADLYSTGGTLVYLTPGFTMPVSDQVMLYANVQIPIYENLTGIQLAPSYIGSVGMKYSF